MLKQCIVYTPIDLYITILRVNIIAEIKSKFYIVDKCKKNILRS